MTRPRIATTWRPWKGWSRKSTFAGSLAWWPNLLDRDPSVEEPRRVPFLPCVCISLCMSRNAPATPCNIVLLPLRSLDLEASETWRGATFSSRGESPPEDLSQFLLAPDEWSDGQRVTGLDKFWPLMLQILASRSNWPKFPLPYQMHQDLSSKIWWVFLKQQGFAKSLTNFFVTCERVGLVPSGSSSSSGRDRFRPRVLVEATANDCSSIPSSSSSSSSSGSCVSKISRAV